MELLEEQDEDELTDVELMARTPDELWYMDLCLETLHRLPSEVDHILGCREYTRLKARSIVKRAQDEQIRIWRSAVSAHDMEKRI